MWRSEGRVTAADSNAPSAQCHIPDMPSCWGNPHWKRLPQRSLLVCMVRSRRSNPKNWSKHTEREWWKEGTDLLQNFLYMSCHSSCRTAVRRRVTGASTIWFLIMQLNQPCNAKQKTFQIDPTNHTNHNLTHPSFLQPTIDTVSRSHLGAWIL